MKKRRYTEEALRKVVPESLCIRGVLRKLGVKITGGSSGLVRRRILEYGIDMSHFLGSGMNQGKAHRGGPKKQIWQEILILRPDDSPREQAWRLRRALIESGRPYRCEGVDCPNPEPQWIGRPLCLHVDHLSGKSYDCRKDNLRFLCPNCHSQTTNFGNNKGMTSLTSRAEGARRYRIIKKKAAVVAELADAHG